MVAEVNSILPHAPGPGDQQPWPSGGLSLCSRKL